MEKKNGFTLIELLAVIAILGVLAIVAVPAVINIYKDAKKNTFISQAKNVYSAVEKRFMSDQMTPATAGIVRRYCYNPGTAGAASNPLDLSGSKAVYYDISVTAAGVVSSFKITDGSYSATKTTSPVLSTDLETLDGTAAATSTITCAV